MGGIWESIFSWDTLWWILLVLYVPSCIGLIVIVLLQKGKGTGFCGAFGMGGGSDAVFGPRSSKSLPIRLTYLAATLFMVIALVMSLVSPHVGKGSAPALVPIDDVETILTTGLSDLGLGEGGGGTDDSAPAATSDDGDSSDTTTEEAPVDAESGETS